MLQKSTKCNENNRTWMILSLAFLVGNSDSLLDLANITIFKLYYNPIKQTHIQLAFKQFTTHKIIETRQCMQACKRWFYLEKWFLLGSKHFKAHIGHLQKW